MRLISKRFETERSHAAIVFAVQRAHQVEACPLGKAFIEHGICDLVACEHTVKPLVGELVRA